MGSLDIYSYRKETLNRKFFFCKVVFLRSMKFQYVLIGCLYYGSAFGATIEVSSWDELNQAISGGSVYANLPNVSTTIQFLGDITHFSTDSTTHLVPLCIDSPNNSFNLLDGCQITINGNGNTLSTNFDAPLSGFFVGGNPFVDTTALSSVRIEDLTVSSVIATGGASKRGGGGAGFGGGLFVNTNTTVVLSNVIFSSCSARGGNGNSGSTSVTGGAGMGGSASSGGGGFSTTASTNGGGCTFLTGDAAAGGIRGSSTGKGGGEAGGINGNNGGDAASGGGGGSTTNGGNGGGVYDPGEGGLLTGAGGNAGIGGGSGGSTSASAAGGGGGGYVGGGGGSQSSFGGGGGGFGGGGGAGSNVGGGGGGGFGGGGGAGGNFYGGGGGGFGGGGGGNPIGGFAGGGGSGGFGGGGGGGSIHGEGVGGFGGGNGGVGISGGAGGGGLGAGGAIFVHTGGTLIVESATFLSNTVQGGIGTNNGSAYGPDIFLVSGGNLNFNLISDLSCYAIGGNYSQGGFTATDSSGVAVNCDPGVTLTILAGDQSSYLGLFDRVLNINSGILAVDSDYCLGYSIVAPNLNGGVLATTNTISTARNFTIGTSGGAFQPAALTTFTVSGTVTGSDGSTLTLDGEGAVELSDIAVASQDSFTVAGAFSGNGSLTKSGEGTLVITGDNVSFTGPTTVAAGQLKVNGSLANSSLLTLSANTTLSGIGGVGPITCFGTISPGNSVGTLSSGSIVLENSSLFFVELDPTGASLLNITGSAALDGTLEVVQDAGFYARSGQYPILQTTEGISGSFSSILLTPLQGFTISLLQNGNNLELIYHSSLLTAGLSGNALIVANYLNQYGGAAAINPLLGFDINILKDALDSISPSRNAYSGYISNLNAFSVNRLVNSHMDYLRALDKVAPKNQFVASLLADASGVIPGPINSERPNHYSTWISSFADFAHQDGSNQNPSFNFISESVLIGFDYRTPSIGTFGTSFGYLHTYFYDDEKLGHGNTNSGFFSLYGDAVINYFYIEPALLGLYNATGNMRHIAFSGFSANASANIYSWELAPHLEIGYDVDFGWLDILPFTSIDYAVNWQRGYTEEGATPYNATQNDKTTSMIRSEIGLKFFQTWPFNWGSIFLKEKASYVFEKPFGNSITTFLTGIPTTFTVTALTQDLNLGSIGLELFSSIGNKSPFGIALSYDGEFGSNYLSNEIMITLNKSF